MYRGRVTSSTALIKYKKDSFIAPLHHLSLSGNIPSHNKCLVCNVLKVVIKYLNSSGLLFHIHVYSPSKFLSSHISAWKEDVVGMRPDKAHLEQRGVKGPAQGPRSDMLEGLGLLEIMRSDPYQLSYQNPKQIHFHTGSKTIPPS